MRRNRRKAERRGDAPSPQLSGSAVELEDLLRLAGSSWRLKELKALTRQDMEDGGRVFLSPLQEEEEEGRGRSSHGANQSNPSLEVFGEAPSRSAGPGRAQRASSHSQTQQHTFTDCIEMLC